MSSNPTARETGCSKRARIAACAALAALVLSACAGTWQQRAPTAIARQEVSFVYVPAVQKFFLAGGRSTEQDAYDPRTDTWSTVAPLPAALDHIQGVELNGRIYYIGGLIAWPLPAVGTVYIYDPVTDTVSSGQPMPSGRERGAGGVAVYNNKIYYAGGLHAGSAVPWFDVYDPATNTWTTLPAMPEARDHFQAGVVGTRFYAIGGRNTSIDATTTVNDAFDFTTNTWITGLSPLPTARGGFATAVLDTKLVLIGGEGGGRTYQTVEAYDTASNSWSTLAPMPTARHGIEAAVCNGAVYLADGGTVQGGSAPTNVHEAFFPGSPTTCP